ncbi:hypothetical protein [Nocardiopsis synnemataformans]|uniref:hypothetical protein n=1 Tax=Nocardiopsis synnemataformans TaxID=61305 RepID=UPI003EBCE79B
MSIRSATVWVITCDAPDCLRLAVPAALRSEQHEKDRRALHLSHTVDAFTAAHEAGWVTEMQSADVWKQYCPAHVDVPSRPRPIREEPAPSPVRTTPRTPAAATPTRGVDDVPLPGMS